MIAESSPQVLKFKKATTKKKLTKRTVESLSVPPDVDGKPSQSWVYDSETPRLAVCVWSSGSRVWYWIGRFNGSMIRYKIGGYPEVTPEQARTLAGKVSANVANGIDPRSDRRAARAEKTLGELWDAYLKDHAEPHKKENSLKSERGSWSRYLKPWSSRKLSAILQRDVQALHAKVGKANGRYAANRMLALLRSMFNIATDFYGFDKPNPCRGVKMFAEESRDRFLQADELPRFLKALEAEPNQLAADALRIMLLAGARKSNVLSMKWEHLNLDSAMWRIPDTKQGEPQQVHLPAEAVAILKSLHERSTGTFVFPAARSGTESGHLVDICKIWNSVRTTAKLPDVRMHDLRRSLGSWMAAGNTSLAIIGKALGHKNESTTAIYSRLALDPVRAAVDKAVAAMMVAGKPTKKTKSKGAKHGR